MIKIGEFNILRVSRLTPFGAYLTDVDSNVGQTSEVLLPNRYVEENLHPGDQLEVFVYTDSEDRAVATTEKPYVSVGHFAFLQVVQINRVGAFMDWGLQKNLLVPFKEQKIKMFPGGIYLVYVYLDNNTKRVVASAKIEKFLGNVFPTYNVGDKVDALLFGKNEVGFQAIVDDRHKGIIYFNETYRPLEIGERVEAYIKNIRQEDAKIDLTLTAPGTLGRIEVIAESILNIVEKEPLHITDKSSPDTIKEVFHCSKKDFKKAVGLLYKDKKIIITENSIVKSN